MRKQSRGTIVNVSSIGGQVGLFPFFTAYHASKFALEGYTESLRQELSEFGINVILIEPGAVGTNFMENMKTAKNFNPNDSPYAKIVQRVFEGAQVMMGINIHPREVAQVIVNAVNSANPNVRYSVGRDAESILKRRAQLSDSEMEKWVRESYMEKILLEGTQNQYSKEEHNYLIQKWKSGYEKAIWRKKASSVNNLSSSQIVTFQ